MPKETELWLDHVLRVGLLVGRGLAVVAEGAVTLGDDGAHALALGQLDEAAGVRCVPHEAVEAGLVNQAVPFAQLEATVAGLAADLASIPSSQLAAMKLVVNQAYENMGLASTQLLGTLMDGMLRNTPEAKAWVDLAEGEGVGAAVAQRDGPFGDYSQGPAELKPDPANVVRAGRAR
jgi:hypothetical protein